MTTTILIPADGQSAAAVGDGSAATPAYTFLTQTNLGMYRAGADQLGFSTAGTRALLLDASQNATFAGNLIMSATAPIFNATAATTYLLTLQNNGTAAAYLDKGGTLVPSVIDPSTYHNWTEWDDRLSSTSFTQNGNVVLGAVNTVSAPLMTSSTMGVAYVNTSSTTQGGYVCLPASIPVVKSAVLTYQWRQRFYLPALSSNTNRYTAYVGGFVGTGSAINTNVGPFAGCYLSYCDNVNSGNWVMGSAVANTRTTGNTSTAAVSGWHNLVITLNNGTYTFVLDTVNIGTVTDNNITTSFNGGTIQAAGLGGIMIIPDGTNFTTQSALMIDRSDIYVTGLSR